MMETTVKSSDKSKTFCNSKIYTPSREKEIRLFDFKFYQKLFIVLIALCTILIFPESPKEMETICENYHSRKLCKVW
ncbi:transcription factor TFIID [Prochlorococcus marinus str. MU1415]|nr:transcription factor TFIID [Prochlorococcus marinus str. MU1415]